MKRRKGSERVGFMDPAAVNQDQVQKQPKTASDAIYRALSEQHYKDCILLPYNFK